MSWEFVFPLASLSHSFIHVPQGAASRVLNGTVSQWQSTRLEPAQNGDFRKPAFERLSPPCCSLPAQQTPAAPINTRGNLHQVQARAPVSMSFSMFEGTLSSLSFSETCLPDFSKILGCLCPDAHFIVCAYIQDKLLSLLLHSRKPGHALVLLTPN